MPKTRVKLRQYGVRVNGVLIRKSFASASAARAWQRAQKQVQDKIRAGLELPIQPTLLSVHSVDFLRSRAHQASYAHQVAWMGKYVLKRPQFHDKYLHELTRPHWKPLFGLSGELVAVHGLSAATHNRIRAMLRKMYEDARREYDPPRTLENPIRDIPDLPEPKKKIPILVTKEEIRKYVIAAYQDPLPSWGIYTAIKLNTGLRQQNIIPLRWKDWRKSERCLHIREKYTRRGFRPGSKSDQDERTSGVNPALETALDSWRKATTRRAPDDFIVGNGKGGFITVHQVWNAHARTLKRAGLPYLSEHKLRHTYATHYLAAGGSIHDLKLNLFHSTITTTEIYAHALQSELSRRAGKFQTEVPAIPAPEKGKE